jgi:signal transduction histidine kinase
VGGLLPVPPPPQPEWRRTAARHPRAVDGAVALAVALIGVPAIIRTDGGAGDWLFVLALALPLVWRRRAPLVVFAILAALGLAQWVVGVPLGTDAALLVSLYTVAVYRPRRWAVGAAAVLEVGVVLAAVRFAPAGDDVVGSLVFLSGLVAAAFFVGTSVQNRRAYLGALVDRATWLERERDQQARLVATAERARIARELHDIVAHSLTVVVTMAEAAAATVDSDPPAARQAMTEVATTGRGALGEMRRLLGVLRTAQSETDEDTGTRTPVPGLERVDELVAGARAAGLPVRLTVSGPARPLPSTLDATAYRVVQESLTNALRHSLEPTRVHVQLRWAADELTMDVTDDGRPTARSGQSGHGLAGMRERLQLFGGSVSTGPNPAGGWTVRAVLPLAEAAA